MLCRQSKLKSVVANMGLQHIKTIEAAVIKEAENCNFELIQLLIILNLIITVLLILAKLKKSKIFQGHLFINMVKINLFLANTQSYVALELELNSAVGNVHLFKFSGALAMENFIVRKNWIWDVLEINWNNTYVTLNDKEISLLGTLMIPLVYKLKVRKLLTERNSLHVYIMLKHRKSWYNLENEQD